MARTGLGIPMRVVPLYGVCCNRGFSCCGALLYAARYRPRIWSMKMRGKYLHPGKILWGCECGKKEWRPFGADAGDWHECVTRKECDA